MKTVVLCSFIVTMLVAATACDGLFGNEEDLTLIGVVWRLDVFEEMDGTTTDIGTQDIYLIFNREGFYGRAFLKRDHSIKGNYYAAPITISPTGTLSFGSNRGFSTHRGLPSGSRYREYVLALWKASHYDIKSNRLRIYSDSVVLKFKPVDSEPDGIPPYPYGDFTSQ